tara:strand:+ start:93 stop:1715 length:1623 start_codon:yes stop_codon:yes gene_type:complete
MATSRSQLSEQIRQLQGGGTPLGLPQDLQQSVGDALAVDTSQLRADVGLESKEQERLNALRALISQRSSAIMQPQNFEDSFTKYKNQLMQIYGSRPRTSIFDLASTVGGAMLAADPTTGAFRSAGLGFAKFAEEERARRERDLAESRAIGLKAFELAKSDEDQAQKLINEFELLRAKQRLDTKVEQVIVTDPAGITVDGKFYEQGSRPLLTDSEKFAYRAQISDAPSPQSGVKVTAAGAIARWQTKEDAEKTIEGLGLSRDSEFFDQAVQQLVPDNDALLGQRIISGGKYMQLTPYSVEGEVYNIFLNSEQGGDTRFSTYAEARLKDIAKAQSDFAGLQLQTIPQVDRALELLLETETGKLTELTLPVKQLFKQVFGTTDPSIANLESLVAISNQLAPKMRPVGSGSTSDMEFDAYRKAILSLGNTPEANYIALYAFKKMTENSVLNNQAEQEALTSDDFQNTKQVNEFLKKEVDTGIFERFQGDGDDEEEILAFMNNLPRGAVFINRDRQGRPLVLTDSRGNDISGDIYVIKGFKFREQ